jgi:hypothetical protein
MDETTLTPDINNDAYNEYMANERLTPEEVSDPGHLNKENRELLDIMVTAQRIGLGAIIPDEFDGHLDATPSAMITGAILEDYIKEPGYDDLSVDSLKLQEVENEAVSDIGIPRDTCDKKNTSTSKKIRDNRGQPPSEVFICPSVSRTDRNNEIKMITLIYKLNGFDPPQFI